jgi:D-xylose transport system ATP-binding protein
VGKRTTGSVLNLDRIVKEFGKVRALDGVSLSVKSGEILALVGENGAGKSTLMKILSGVYPSGTFEGSIRIDGEEARFTKPADAEKAGIAIIHQELSAFAHLSVLENLFVGRWPARAGFVDDAAMRAEASQLLKRFGEEIPLDVPMRELSTGSQQLVEIAKALARNPHILILDEPTSSLTSSEIQRLFGILNGLKAEGHILVFISHKMDEIFSLCDRVVVLRDGKSVHQGETKDLDSDTLIKHMVGRPLDRLFPERKPKPNSNEDVLNIVDLEFKSNDGLRTFGPFNFHVQKGEIVGFAGLLGAGRSELAHALIGEPRKALEAKLAIVGEDRKRDSIFPARSLVENSTLSHRVLGLLFGWIDAHGEEKEAETLLSRMRTRYGDLAQGIEELSGGNQQKIVIARALALTPELLILDEPTRGVDVGAKYEIAQILFELVDRGQSLIVMSSDLPELIGICDRIYVMSEGKITREFSREEFSQEAIMKAAVRAVAPERLSV